MTEQKLPVPFRGSKGPQTPPTPTRTPDTLRSEDAVEAILAVSEGEIEGFADGLKSVYVGDTPLENDDGSKNFEVFDVTVRKGLPEVEAEPLVPLLGGLSSNLQVNTELTYQVPVVRQLTLGNVDAIDLRFNISQLFLQTDEGVFEANLYVAIYLRRSDQTDQPWARHFVPLDAEDDFLPLRGKTTSTYIKELRIPVYEKGDFFWQVKVTKFSEDSGPVDPDDPDNTSSAATDVVWESIQQVFHTTSKFADTAIMQIYARASNQFSSIPTFSAVFKGIKCKIPANYDPLLKTYTGIWDGTFKTAWTDNPAWILYEYITNDRYGMSTVTNLNIDKYEVYEAGEFCDELVDDGSGGQEPRFTLNCRIQTPRQAIEQARYIAGVMGAVLFDDLNGTIFMRVDRNEAAKHIFSYENISEEGFNYEFTDVMARYNDITVSFINPLTNWEEDRRRVFDQDSIDAFGRIPYDFVAFGCTKESEALRRAYYKLNTALTETMMVSFKTNRLGLDVQPFDIILISDVDLGYSLSGRIQTLDAGRTTITLRDPLALEAGINYTGYFRTPDGVVERTVNSASTGLVTEFTVSSALPSDTPDFCTFLLEEDAGEGIGAPKPFRVVRVEESESNPDDITITGHEVNRNKFTDSEALVVSDPTNYSGVGDPANIPGPTNVEFRDFYQKSANAVWTIVTPTFDSSAYRFYTGNFDVYSRPVVDDEPVGSFVQREVFYGDTLVNHPEGPHEFIVVPRNTFGQTPPIALMSIWEFTVSGVNSVGIPPKAVTNVTIYPKPTGFVVDWDIDPSDVDYVHHFVVKEGATEETAVVIGDNIKETFFLIDPMSKRSYNLYIYAVSNSYVYSDAVTVAHTNEAPEPPTNLKIEVSFESVFAFFDRNTEVDIVGYRLQIRKLGDSDWIDMDPSGLIDNTESDTAYEIRVAAQDALTLLLVDEIWSVPLSFRTRDTQGVEKGFDDVRQTNAVNLLRNGSFEKSLTNWTLSTASVGTAEDAPAAPYADPLNGTSKVLKLGDGTSSFNEIISDKVVVRPLVPYTLAFDMLKDASSAGENHYATLVVYDAAEGVLKTYDQSEGKLIIDPEELSTTEYRRFHTTFEVPEGAVKAEVLLVSQASGIVYIDGVQLQKGRVATVFNPHVSEELSPEDLGTIVNPDNTPPETPTALSASGAFKNVNLSWTPPSDSDIASYEVYVSTTDDVATGVLGGSATSPVFSYVTPSSNVTYYFWVRAIDTTGNKGAFSVGASAKTVPLSAADFQDLSIVNAMIANAAIDTAKISELSASKITAGTITAAQINLGNDRFRLEGAENRLRVLDTQGVERVRLGRIASGAQDFGLQVRDLSGKLILGITGLGIDVVGSGQLIDGSITSDHLTANSILADKIAAGAITASKIAASSITGAKIVAASITADKLTVGNLAAITADLGTVTAGRLQGEGLSNNYWDLNSGEFKVGSPDGSEYIWYDPNQDKIFIKGTVEFQSSAVNWQDIINRPQSLSQLSAAEGAKLSGIDEGADVTSQNTAANTSKVGLYAANEVAYWANDPAVRIAQQSTTINGNKITTGSIAANRLDVANLSAISANIGTVTAGTLRNSNNTARMNLAATGSAEFLNCNNKFVVKANGEFSATEGAISGNLLVAGSVTADRIVTNGISQVYKSLNVVAVNSTGQEKFIVFVEFDSQAMAQTIAGSQYGGELVLAVNTYSSTYNNSVPGKVWSTKFHSLRGAFQVPGLYLNQYGQGLKWPERTVAVVSGLPPGNPQISLYLRNYNQYGYGQGPFYRLAHHPSYATFQLTAFAIKK